MELDDENTALLLGFRYILILDSKRDIVHVTPSIYGEALKTTVKITGDEEFMESLLLCVLCSLTVVNSAMLQLQSIVRTTYLDSWGQDLQLSTLKRSRTLQFPLFT